MIDGLQPNAPFLFALGRSLKIVADRWSTLHHNELCRYTHP